MNVKRLIYWAFIRKSDLALAHCFHEMNFKTKYMRAA